MQGQSQPVEPKLKKTHLRKLYTEYRQGSSFELLIF